MPNFKKRFEIYEIKQFSKKKPQGFVYVSWSAENVLNRLDLCSIQYSILS